MSFICAQISLGEGLITAGAQLVELDLSDNAFGPDGVRGFEALLKSPACFTLHELKLNNCGMGIGGGKVGAAGPSFTAPLPFTLPPCQAPCNICLPLKCVPWPPTIRVGWPVVFSLQRRKVSKAAAHSQWGEEMEFMRVGLPSNHLDSGVAEATQRQYCTDLLALQNAGFGCP